MLFGIMGSLRNALSQANPVVLTDLYFEFIDRGPVVWKLGREITDAGGVRI